MYNVQRVIEETRAALRDLACVLLKASRERRYAAQGTAKDGPSSVRLITPLCSVIVIDTHLLRARIYWCVFPISRARTTAYGGLFRVGTRGTHRSPSANTGTRRSLAAGFRPLLAGAWLASVCACANLAGPDYARPEAPTKAEWSQDDTVAVSASETIRPDWWKNFDDPYLDELIAKAIANNIDLKMLAGRTGVAEAAIDQANAARLPTVDTAYGASFRKSEGRDLSKQYSNATALGWELDIWGKAKKGVQAQKAQFRATEADWRAGYLTLVSDVSSTYFQIRQFDEQIDQLQAALSYNQQTLSIYESLYHEGIVPQTRLLQQHAEVRRLNTFLGELRRLRKLSENALATLLGVPAGDFQVPAGHLRDTVQIIPIPPGLPAELLSRRPDIVAAEYRVLEAHELVGQARLARLPTISLTASGGNTSLALTDLLKTFTFGFSPTVSIPIFDPNVDAQLKVSEAQTKVVEQEYRRTVIRAFEEVENALVNLNSHRQQREDLLARRQNLRTVAEQIRAQLKEGMVSQLEVFESERSLLEAELALLRNHQQILTDTVALYKALGGGWPREVVEQSS